MGITFYWISQEIALKMLTIIFEHKISFRHWHFSLVTRSPLIFVKGLTHIKPFLHALCYFSSVIRPMHVWKLRCKSEWFEDVSKFSWVFLIFQKGNNKEYKTFLKKSRMSFRIFRRVITEVGPFLKKLFVRFQPQWIDISAIMPFLRNHC